MLSQFRLNLHGSAFLMWLRLPLNIAAERINCMSTNYEKLSSDIRHSLALIELVKARKAKFLKAGDNYEFIFDPDHDQIIDLLDTRAVKKFLRTSFPEEINRPFRHRYTSDFQVMSSKLCVPVLELLRDATNCQVPSMDPNKPQVNRSKVAQWVLTTYIDSIYQERFSLGTSAGIVPAELEIKQEK